MSFAKLDFFSILVKINFSINNIFLNCRMSAFPMMDFFNMRFKRNTFFNLFSNNEEHKLFSSTRNFEAIINITRLLIWYLPYIFVAVPVLLKQAIPSHTHMLKIFKDKVASESNTEMFKSDFC